MRFCSVFATYLLLFLSFSISAEETENSVPSGKELFSSRCTLCHGSTGLGDGRLAKIITSPPPANLTLSKADSRYIRNIIFFGGERMGRSSQMPPWGDEFNQSEIDSLVNYVQSLQTNTNE